MSGTSRCAACKYLRRRCPPDCIFSPYFPSNNPKRFACVHRIYGASNVSKMLQKLPMELRGEAAESLTFEAQCRIQDPVYGCVGLVSFLQQQIQTAESQLARAQAEIIVIAPHVQKQILQHPPQLRQFEPQFVFNNATLPPEGPQQVNFGHFGYFPQA